MGGLGAQLEGSQHVEHKNEETKGRFITDNGVKRLCSLFLSLLPLRKMGALINSRALDGCFNGRPEDLSLKGQVDPTLPG